MAIDTGIPRSRRALLAGGVGGLAALVASVIGRPLSASAAEPYVGLGQANTSSATTLVQNLTDADPPLLGMCLAGDGVVGESQAPSKSGVYGHTTHNSGYGVYGRNPTSWGYLGGYNRGVRGGSDTGYAVYGVSTSGYGTYGSSTSGIGVFGHSASNDALYGSSVSGRGVYAYSGSANGVFAYSSASDQAAVLGRSYGSSTGVLGYSGTSSPPAAPAKTGVYGYAAQDTHAVGVRGASALGDAIVGVSNGPGKSGVYGLSGVADGFGIVGRNHATLATGALGAGSTGAHGASVEATGVAGTSGTGAPTPPVKTGVYGYAAQDGSARGVWGKSTAGRGVYGQATSGQGIRGYATSGTAGYFASAEATTGYALRAVGRVKLDQCAGVATINAGSTSVTVTPGIDLVATSAVVATLMGNAGGSTTVKRVAVSATANTFTIHLTASSTANVKVAWHVFG